MVGTPKRRRPARGRGMAAAAREQTMGLQDRADLLRAREFLGVPIQDFERAGRNQLILLLMAGLTPASKVVDLGCGILRAGYWLIHFLDPGCYHGIEPHAERLRIGVETILDAETREAKRPRFDTNPNFDTAVFGQKFDYFLAYSIWTHASKGQIQTMLDAFLRDSRDHAQFLTTILPAGWRRPDYKGERWFGTSHESDAVGCVSHDLGWIRSQCQRRSLIVRKLGKDAYGQSWLSISRGGGTGTLTDVWSASRWRRLLARVRTSLGLAVISGRRTR